MRRQKRLSLIYVWSSHLVTGPTITGRMIVTNRRGPDSMPNALIFHNWGFGLPWLLIGVAEPESAELELVVVGIANAGLVVLLDENGVGN